MISIPCASRCETVHSALQGVSRMINTAGRSERYRKDSWELASNPNDPVYHHPRYCKAASGTRVPPKSCFQSHARSFLESYTRHPLKRPGEEKEHYGFEEKDSSSSNRVDRPFCRGCSVSRPRQRSEER